jgi:hypothetical protein
MFTPRGPLNGPAAIRSLFQAIFTEFGKPGTTSVNRRRGRRLRVFAIADIVPTFREMSTKPDQVQVAVANS